MKILITGSTGLLGQALVRRLAPPCDVVGLSRHAPPSYGHDRHLVCDLTDQQATTRVVRRVNPDVVIHTQALSDVDCCERDPEQASLQNAQTTDHLCQALKARSPLLIALSTDYVFDGVKGSPYDETDTPNPINEYGRMKLAAERLVLDFPRGCVVRTSTLFGPGRRNFCDSIIQRVRQGEAVEAFVDQTTSPTYTEDLAEAIHEWLEAMATRAFNQLPRIYHIVNTGACRRVEFTKRVVAALDGPESLVQPIRMEDQQRPAKRPAYSALTSRHLQPLIGRTLRPWDEALLAYLRQHHPPTCLSAEGGSPE